MPWKRWLGLLRSFDWLLLAAVVVLLCFGLAALYSIALSSDQPDFSHFNRQLIFAGIGLVFLFGLTFIDYRLWRDAAGFIYIASLVLLITVLFLGRVVNATRGWFTLGGVSLQPVELAKIALIITLAWLFSRYGSSIREFRTFAVSGLLALIPCALVLLQPDFGSAVILFGIWFGLFFLAGGNRWYSLAVIGLTLVALLVGWLYIFQPYQKDRIMTFINPQADPYNRGYHVRQAMIAVGAGGLYGSGIGFGSQSQLKFIPESQTDFIFAVVAEELGLLGVGLVLLCWGVIFYRLFRIIFFTRDDFVVVTVLGVSLLFFIQVVINIGMNIGIMPVTGIPLPFISYGGSFLITGLASLGIIQSMGIRSQR